MTFLGYDHFIYNSWNMIFFGAFDKASSNSQHNLTTVHVEMASFTR